VQPLISLLIPSLLACNGGGDDSGPATATGWVSHGDIAADISAPLGDPVPFATATQLETFARGEQVALRRFSLADGLGPGFNVTFCAACHEKPVTGGAAGLYRNFYIAARTTEDGVVVTTDSANNGSGVIRMYYYGHDFDARPEVDDAIDVIGQRNPIPFFGVGLIAELSEDEILSRADPDDEDGDGISGRPNYEEGFVGRFGMKAQTVSIEGFIRGPLFNHLGVTTDPLCHDQRAALPVDSSSDDDPPCDTMGSRDLDWLVDGVRPYGQAAAQSGPLEDEDDAPDPELSTDDLFDLVSWAMLLAAPEVEDISDNALAQQGQMVFDEIGCGSCHAPRLNGPRGPLPVYSDLLLHDMGDDLGDGLDIAGFQEADGNEFRTQPLWGVGTEGPYLHDGRATTLIEAIELHGGEAAGQARRFAARSDDDKAAMVEFLTSLGARSQHSMGLLPPDQPLPAVGDWGGPLNDLSAEEEASFQAALELFDREFGHSEGTGGPRFNGDSCRACHFEPVIGGAGPRGVNVMRHGILNDNGEYTVPSVGTILHKQTALLDSVNAPQLEANIFEHRNTPHLFGLGLIDGISEDTIIANADPDDTASPDGITGRVSWTDEGRVGRFGWKAQVPSVEEFVRDALTSELGMTIEYQEGLTFGRIQDNDAVADPEIDVATAEQLTYLLSNFAPPPRTHGDDTAAEAAGEALFDSVGCAACHIPALDGADGPVPLYSDLLLHEILPPDSVGIEDASASMWEFRTAPLWGIAQTAPYMHNGAADTIEEAIALHDGEAVAARDAFDALDDSQRSDLLAFLQSL